MPPIDDEVVRSMPTFEQVRDALLYAGLVPMVAAAIVYLPFTFAKRAVYLGAVLAVVVGFSAANIVREYPNFLLDPRVLPAPEPNEPDPNLDPRQVGKPSPVSNGDAHIILENVVERLALLSGIPSPAMNNSDAALGLAAGLCRGEYGPSQPP